MMARTLCLVLGLLMCLQPRPMPVASAAPVVDESYPATALPARAPARDPEKKAPAPEGAGALGGLTAGVVSDFAAGYWHGCAVTISGGVKCWGNNRYGQIGDGSTTDRPLPTDVIGLTSGLVAVAGGSHHTCALTSGGAVKCWGSNSYGQLGDDTTTDHLTPVQVAGLSSGVTAIAAGYSHTCALTSGGAAKCWGRNAHGQLGDGTTTDHLTPVQVAGLSSGATALAAGYWHSCALKGGAMQCWGHNDYGQLGNNTTNSSSTPVGVSGLTSGVTAIASGWMHTCAVVNGGAKCWGWNGSWQLGDGTQTDHNAPVDVSGLSSGVASLMGGGYHTCAVSTGGGAKCWGNGFAGQLGRGEDYTQYTPADVTGLTSGVALMSGGEFHTCALMSAGQVKCWGENTDGQLGEGTLGYTPQPADVVGLEGGALAIGSMSSHTCTATTEGAKCWGANSSGKLGDGTRTNRATPVQVTGLTSGVTDLAPGHLHTCALVSGGVKCWGSNYEGQLGDGTNNNSTTPVTVIDLGSDATRLDAGYDHSCALTALGAAKCWGANEYGQLGDGTSQDRSTPVIAGTLTSGVKAIAAGDGFTCALTDSGGVKCWGRNNYGQLGDGGNVDRPDPGNVTDLFSGVTVIGVGWDHACAATASGVKCWGANWRGQLGDGTSVDQNEPVSVIGVGSGVTDLAAGESHTCALVNGGMKCWGNNWDGQLGDGTTLTHLTPVDVPTLSNGVLSITAGTNHSCAIAAGNVAKCWGDDFYGQLGDGVQGHRNLPGDVIGLASASLASNHVTGQPGSYFTFTGADFPAGGIATVKVNGQTLTTSLAVDGSGNVTFLLNTAGADPGRYVVTVSVNPSASTSFLLAESEPLWPQEGSGPVFDVPVGIALDNFVYLPLAMR